MMILYLRRKRNICKIIIWLPISHSRKPSSWLCDRLSGRQHLVHTGVMLLMPKASAGGSHSGKLHPAVLSIAEMSSALPPAMCPDACQC